LATAHHGGNASLVRQFFGHRLMATILSNPNRLFTGRFLDKSVVKWILNIPPWLVGVEFNAPLDKI